MLFPTFLQAVGTTEISGYVNLGKTAVNPLITSGQARTK